VSGIVSGIGQLFQAKESENVSDFNSKVFEQRAKVVRENQKLLEEQKRKTIKSQIGTQVAMFAKSGVRFSGSPIDTVVDSLSNAEMDIAIDKYNSEVEARGFQDDARIEKSKGQSEAAQLRAGASSTFARTATSLLSRSQGNKKVGEGINVSSKFGVGAGVVPS
jgi:hypothetical protein